MDFNEWSDRGNEGVCDRQPDEAAKYAEEVDGEIGSIEGLDRGTKRILQNIWNKVL